MATASFREPNRDRLIRRLRRVTEGDLASPELNRLADGDLSVVSDLSVAARQGVLALSADDPAARGELEKLVGEALDYVPVAYLDLARMASSAVARVVTTDNREPIGSGVMVSPRLFLTNNHVTADIETAQGQLLQFHYELNIDGTPKPVTEFTLNPNDFFWTSPEPELDATLVAVGNGESDLAALSAFGHLPLSGADDKHARGDFVNIIQHPEGDFKQIALRENRVIGQGKSGTTLHYQADTLGGSSGSPVLNDQFQLVALHHAGGPRNESVLDDGDAVPDDSNEGIRISAIVQQLRTRMDTLPDGLRELLAAALDPPATGPQLEAAKSVAPSATPIIAAAGTSQMIPGSLPIRIDVTTGSGVAVVPDVVADVPSAPEATVAPSAGLDRNREPDPNYGRRRGYDADFLSQTVEIPGLSDDLLQLAALPKGGKRTTEGLRLDYLHFSVIVHAQRRLPILTAVNIDGRRLLAVNRETGEVEVTEQWFVDPRIPADQQLDQSVFEKQRPRIFDRGHMVRRLDPAWGSADTATRAAADTFHFANCCPQISAFNQRAAMWAGIENYALNNARSERQRIVVFSGPVFADDDPEYRSVAVPRAFWKVVVREEGTELRCTGFLADQGDLLHEALGDRPEAFGELGAAAVFQRPLGDIEAQSHLDLAHLRDHDTLQLEAAAGRQIESLDDMQW